MDKASIIGLVLGIGAVIGGQVLEGGSVRSVSSNEKIFKFDAKGDDKILKKRNQFYNSESNR